MSQTSAALQRPKEDATADTISVPVSLLQRMSEAVQVFEEFQDELEDYLISQDTDFLARMHRARAHHAEGETRTLDDLKQELCIE